MGYLEQTPVYNAINFSIAAGANGLDNGEQGTALITKVVVVSLPFLASCHRHVLLLRRHSRLRHSGELSRE